MPIIQTDKPKLFIEISQNQLERLTKQGKTKTENGITLAQLMEDIYTPVKIKGEPDPVVEFKTGLGEAFSNWAGEVRKGMNKSLYGRG